MATAPAGTGQDTRASDLALLSGSFARHLKAANRSDATIKSYGAALALLDTFLAEQGMPRTTEGIRREHLESFLVDLQVRRKQRPATVANRYRSLQQFFRWLVEEDELRESPMARMKPPTIPEEPPAILRDEDVTALLKSTAGKGFDERRDRAIIRLLLDTGVRRAELAGLRLEDVDREAKKKDGGVIYVVGKGRRPRAVPYADDAAKALDAYIDFARKKHPHANLKWLWLGKKGQLTENGISQVIRRRGAEAGLDHLHPHLFRHTFAHEMLVAGMQEGDLMRLAGWKSRQMVGRYGASAADERARDAYRRVKEEARQR